MSITNWPLTDQPREKLLTRGANKLSDAELLAIFLRCGVKGKSAVAMAHELLQDFHGLAGLLEADQNTFCKYHGLGRAKYVVLQACLEMTTRFLYSRLQKTTVLQDPLTTASYLLSRMRQHHREVFAVMFLDTQCQLIAYEELFYGSIHELVVYPREVIKSALKHNAAAVILAHNHPSGEVAPSQQDLDMTNKLKELLTMLDISLHDHMIVGGDQVFSFVQKGLLS